MDTDNFTFTYPTHKQTIEHSEKWVAKIENEWAPNDPERWMFNTLDEMLDFLKKELAEGDELEGYDFDEFFTELEEEANEEGCAIRTLKNGSLDVFSCKTQQHH